MRNQESKILKISREENTTGFLRNKVAVLNTLSGINIKDVIKTDGYIISLCLEGKGTVHFNGDLLSIHKNDLFVCPPNVIIENGMMSVDFKCRCIFLAKDYITGAIPMVDNYWDLKFLFEKMPVVELLPDEVSNFCQYHDLIGQKIATQADNVYSRRVIDALLQAFVYDFQGVLVRMGRKQDHPFTSAESLFKQFVDILSSSYPKSRRVAFYADRLSITPKYLTAICGKIEHMSASKIIDRYVMKDVEYLLRSTRKSIKEISNELDFPNLSFFGKYVKQHWGLSPRKLREKFD